MPTLQLFSKYGICYGVFFLLTYFSKLNQGHKLVDPNGFVKNPGTLAGLQIAGILWLGVIPAVLFKQSLVTIIAGNHFPGTWKLIVVFLLVVNAIAFSEMLANQYRINSQNTGCLLISTGFLSRYWPLRIVFLVAYESWFRGFLLADCINNLAIPLAVCSNVFLYTLLHSWCGRKEILVCIPFGILLCVLSIWIGAAWPAIVLHSAVALSYEYRLSSRFFTPKNVFA